ncbi:hypothetical protein ACFLY1_00490 [Patescibacteria group bacterium]
MASRIVPTEKLTKLVVNNRGLPKQQRNAINELRKFLKTRSKSNNGTIRIPVDLYRKLTRTELLTKEDVLHASK